MLLIRSDRCFGQEELMNKNKTSIYSKMLKIICHLGLLHSHLCKYIFISML